MVSSEQPEQREEAQTTDEHEDVATTLAPKRRDEGIGSIREPAGRHGRECVDEARARPEAGHEVAESTCGGERQVEAHHSLTSDDRIRDESIGSAPTSLRDLHVALHRARQRHHTSEQADQPADELGAGPEDRDRRGGFRFERGR